MNAEELREKLYEAGMHVDHMLWLGGMNHNASEKLIELLEYDELEEVVELFGLEKDSSVLEFLEDEPETAAEFLVEEKNGFVALCEAAVPRDISFNPAGKVESWSTGGVYWIIKTYGDTPEKAVEKALLIQQERFTQETQRQWEKKNAKK